MADPTADGAKPDAVIDAAVDRAFEDRAALEREPLLGPRAESGGMESVRLHQPVDGDNNVSLPISEFPTCNYDACENASYKEYKEALYETGNAGTYNVLRWGLVLVIGMLTAAVAYFIDQMVEKLTHMKNSQVISLLEEHPDNLAAAMLRLLLINAGFVAVAALLVAAAPVAGGSGIPEIKCYLNGLKLPRVLELQTLVAKAVGVLFSVSGGLPCGKEGPMIHSGAIIAAGITQGKLPYYGTKFEDTLHSAFLPFRDDKNKRDFVSCGAAAGVSAAFGAPVGGVLFALEEGCSYWDTVLTWRIFFGSIVCAFSMALFNTRHTLNSPGMINFGDFSTAGFIPFQPIEVIWFLLIGALGGLGGAAFNAVNMKITAWRKRVFPTSAKLKRRRAAKFLEAIAVSLLVSCSIWVCVAGVPPRCSTRPVPGNESAAAIVVAFGGYGAPNGAAEDVNSEAYVSVPGCDGAREFNTLATLQLNSAASTLRLLFHFDGNLDPVALLIHGVIYLIIMVVTYGVAVPSGLFVPSLVGGAVFGRIIGQLVKQIPYATFLNLHPGTYALVGSAAFLAGVCRLTFSLAVILIEATRDIAYALPLMLTIMTAKMVGDLFNKGIYDEHIEFRHLAFLEHSIARQPVRNTTVADFMTKRRRLVAFNPVERVGNIIDVLRRYSFCGIPVCRDHLLGGQDGLMTRSRLLALLTKRSVFRRHRRVVVEVSALTTMSHEGLLAGFPDAQRVWDRCAAAGMDHAVGEVGQAALPDLTESEQVKRMTPLCVWLTGSQEEVTLPYGAVHDAPSDVGAMVPWNEFCYPFTDYRRLKGEEGLRWVAGALSAEDMNSFVDLRPYMNPQPFLVPDTFSFERCYALFRSVGMRHMLVIGADHSIAGIVTRYDLWNRLHLLEHPPEGYKNDRGRLVRVLRGRQASALRFSEKSGGGFGGSEFSDDDIPDDYNPNF
eukprot:TRINITY_DN1207_c2_g1_i1.p1 TRINITY_DN1207_c2_g1~~TRINITY_DN1207_c2_g1_i1.p1  ORF type:complete len:963 (+),score=348.45 TRINITY_DN1207_c2_g1_i1:57-2891(+)